MAAVAAIGPDPGLPASSHSSTRIAGLPLAGAHPSPSFPASKASLSASSEAAGN